MVYLGMIGPWQITLVLITLIIPIFALVDILRNEFSGNNKLIWLLVLVFFNIIGAILYFILGSKQKI